MKTNNLPKSIKDACTKFNLIQQNSKFSCKRITDGVSSDIWYIKTINRAFCAKRALSKLTVKEDWHAPVSRSNYEAKYFEVCKKIIPESFPKVLGHDKRKYILAMEWYDSKTHEVWKKKLLSRKVDQKDTEEVAEILGKIHSVFYKDKEIEKNFNNDKTFHDIRIEPYLLFTSKSYPNFQKEFLDMAENLKKNKRTLIHGDFSPKNILISKTKPKILDAETACWGDPTFDLAFCLNHILLKSILQRKYNINYTPLLLSFVNTYFNKFKAESKKNMLAKLFKLLAMLLLARVDGKSPVEYLKSKDKIIVRNLGKNLLEKNITTVSEMMKVWTRYLES